MKTGMMATAMLATGLQLGCAGTTAHYVPTTEPVELRLTKADGETMLLSQFRGKPLLLFLFATYDSGSQLALMPLERFVASRPQLQVLGIAAQADPSQFLHLYANALDVSFTLAYEPEQTLVSGQSGLGKPITVPSFVVLDENGQVQARHIGVADEQQLAALLDGAF